VFSLEFAVAFVILGAGMRAFLGGCISLWIIIGITVGWLFAFGPWAIVTFIELLRVFVILFQKDSDTSLSYICYR
jgi:hypothetical protein